MGGTARAVGTERWRRFRRRLMIRLLRCSFAPRRISGCAPGKARQRALDERGRGPPRATVTRKKTATVTVTIDSDGRRLSKAEGAIRKKQVANWKKKQAAKKKAAKLAAARKKAAKLAAARKKAAQLEAQRKKSKGRLVPNVIKTKSKSKGKAKAVPTKKKVLPMMGGNIAKPRPKPPVQTWALVPTRERNLRAAAEASKRDFSVEVGDLSVDDDDSLAEGLVQFGKRHLCPACPVGVQIASSEFSTNPSYQLCCGAASNGGGGGGGDWTSTTYSTTTTTLTETIEPTADPSWSLSETETLTPSEAPTDTATLTMDVTPTAVG